MSGERILNSDLVLGYPSINVVLIATSGTESLIFFMSLTVLFSSKPLLIDFKIGFEMCCKGISMYEHTFFSLEITSKTSNGNPDGKA